MNKFKNKPLFYLCTVYSKHPEGLEKAYTDAATLLGTLLRQGVRIFCPITHCHTASTICGLPSEFDWWADFDEGWIDKSDGVIVAKMDNWGQSKGITHEIEYAFETGKGVVFAEVEEILNGTLAKELLKDEETY